MELDLSFPEKKPFLSRICSNTKSEIPIEENTTFTYQNNLINFQHLSLNDPNHEHSTGFPIEGSSSFTTPLFSLSSTTPPLGYPNESLQRGFLNTYYSMNFVPNNTKVEFMHGSLNTNKGIWDFSNKNPLPSSANATSQPQRKITPNFRNNIINKIKSQWSAEEDRVLLKLVKRFGLKKWSQISRLLKGKIGKQCRERWHNHLKSKIKKVALNEEDKLLIKAHKEFVNKWAKIARRMSGKTENTIKNNWSATKCQLNNAIKHRVKCTTSKGAIRLYQSYMRQVTKVEKELKKPMNNL
ncbi:transcription factor MYB118 isoform X2 [Cajanus cajan]|uniref:transcription factor MYB118 isoform X2 n=1 Tax=Cajanus cajan TaxID=3821 RepID=UPI0010FBAB48|nr:transcription factor MYB118 isoform X2 [Cajanus cajan]